MTKTMTLHVITEELRAKFLSYHAEIGFIDCEQPRVLIYPRYKGSKSRSPQSHGHLKVKDIPD